MGGAQDVGAAGVLAEALEQEDCLIAERVPGREPQPLGWGPGWSGKWGTT